MFAVIDISNPATNPTAKYGNLGLFINTALPLVSLVAAVLFLGMFLYAGIIWLTAGDKADNVTKAQKIMTYAVIGLIIVVCGYLVVKVLGVVLNVSDQIPL